MDEDPEQLFTRRQGMGGPYVPPCDQNGRPEHLFGSYVPSHFVVPERLRDKPTELIETVNDWHFAMINDLDRNKFYQTLLHAAIDEDSVVLEIGAGSGLLSIMAAKAGARRVIAIEANREMATLATQIIAANHMSDRIQVINKMSTDVEPSELVEMPSILVSEILGTLLLGESALHYVEDARARLLAHDGLVIPALGTQYITLIDSDEVRQITSVRSWEGIDLRHFNALQDTTSLVFTKQYGFRFSSCSHTMLSEPLAVLKVDFSSSSTDTAFPLERRLRFQALETGTAHAALAFWDVSDPDRGNVMSTDPRSTLGNFPRDMQWGQALQLLEDTTDGCTAPQPIPLTVTKGEWLVLIVRYARDGVNFQCQVERERAGGTGTNGVSSASASAHAAYRQQQQQQQQRAVKKPQLLDDNRATQPNAGRDFDRNFPPLG
jgi:protein arginine N-methyltransferase 7